MKFCAHPYTAESLKQQELGSEQQLKPKPAHILQTSLSNGEAHSDPCFYEEGSGTQSKASKMTIAACKVLKGVDMLAVKHLQLCLEKHYIFQWNPGQ